MSTTKRQRATAAPKKRQLNVRVPEEVARLLDQILERDGVPYGAQIERAVRLWAEHKGIEVSHGNRKAEA